MTLPDPNEVITVTIGGKTFRAGRRTAAHLEWTIERLAKVHPGARLVILQTCYHTGVSASAGTHDKDGVLDVWIEGLPPLTAQRFLRRHGWAAWYRTPIPGLWGPHIHMVSLGVDEDHVGFLVPGQIEDYYHHRTGLKGHAADNSWHPPDIDSTIFDYRTYTEAHMPLNDEDLDKVQERAELAAKNAVEAMLPAIVKAIMNEPVRNTPEEVSVRKALRKGADAARLTIAAAQPEPEEPPTEEPAA